jgi:hypothetical protein
MALLMILALVAALAVLAVVILVAVIIGIHSEPNPQMATQPRGPLSTLVRCLLGVYVARPINPDINNEDREECLTGNSTDWWNKGGWGR